MSSLVTVRPVEASDQEAIGRLGALLVTEHHDFDPRRFIAPLPGLPQRYGEFLLAQAGRAKMVVLVAQRSGEVVGYSYVGMEGNDYMALRGPAGLLYDLVVDPEHRRQGIGSKLLEASLAALQRLGAPRVLLFTAEKNAAARAMFARAGFRATMVEMTRELGGG
jgi:ribosomal protein S18 acetylase RimI-like enzyme